MFAAFLTKKARAKAGGCIILSRGHLVASDLPRQGESPHAMRTRALYPRTMPTARRRLRRRCCAAWLVVSCLAIVARAGASTVLPLTIEQLSDAAGQVIEGTVAATESSWSADGATIVTRVQFEQVDYHKGSLADSGETFELVVPGGVVGDASLQITHAPRFEPGDRWLLFLHPEYSIHPVVGIHRGAFRIETDSDGRRTVHAASGAALTGFDDTGLPIVAHASSADFDTQRPRCVLGSTTGSVIGVRPLAQAGVQAMSYDEFIGRVRPVLEASRDHALSVPAGRAKLMRMPTAAPLRIRSPARTQRDRSERVEEASEAARSPKEQRRGR